MFHVARLTGAAGLVWTLATVPASSGQPPVPPTPPPATSASPSQEATPEEVSPAEHRRRVLDAEDARDASPAGIAPILEALRSKDNETRRIAVRALGRFERPTLLATIAPALVDPAPAVRAEATNAMAQTTVAGGDLGLASDLLLAQAERESHPLVRGALALALGRLPYKDAEAVRGAERAIVATLRPAPSAEAPARSNRDIPAERIQFAPPVTLLGGLRGLESLARLQAKTYPLEPATITLLKELAVAWRSALARSEGGPTAEAASRLRRLALASLVSASGADATTISTAFGDADEQVRRLAAQAAAAAEPLDTKLVERAVRDQGPTVRTAIVQALARREHPSTCGYAGLLLRDPDPHVAIAALDVAARACVGNTAAVGPIAAMASRLAPPPLPDVGRVTNETPTRGPEPTTYGVQFRGQRQPTWHLPAHALVALAQLAPDQALQRLDKFVKDERWQVRMYAARAAGLARAADALTSLAEDKHDNVREAAIAGLRQVKGREADEIFVAALERRDYQLLMTAAQALEGTALKAEASAALLEALDRVTAEKRETSRDARKALLTRLAETGTPTLAARLSPYVKDFDPVIADLAASLASKWTGSPVKAAPQPLPRAARPSATDIEAMSATRVVFTIRDVGQFEIKLLATEAPLNTWRFLRLARERFYDGRTIHRVVPNFVLQGGSPGANEYVGDGPYTRDEVGLQSNLRGTIGVSTRGRDTGDGQIYFNLVDNMRLDHTYTVFAQIEKGIEVMDAILEGDVIEDVDVIGGRR